jgi:signal transduction histidine kinase
VTPDEAVRTLRDSGAALAAVRPGWSGLLVDAATAAFGRLVGSTPEALEGVDLEGMLSPWDRPAVAGLCTAATAGGATVADVRVGGRSPTGLPFSIRLGHLDAGGVLDATPAGPHAYWADARTEPPVARSALAGIDSALSHDVRGALRSVKSFLELVERSEALAGDEKAARFLGIARSAGTDADTMSERLVHLLRVRERPLAMTRVGLPAIVRAAVAGSLAEHADGAAQRIDLGALDDLPAVVGNGELLTELVEELLQNAHKFAGEGAVVRLSAVVQEGWIELRVADDGAGTGGIDAGLAEDAFRLFRLLQPKGQVPGVGMGLPLARAIAEAHGGTLHLEPGDAGGTVAVVRLLGAPAPARPDAPGAATADE